MGVSDLVVPEPPVGRDVLRLKDIVANIKERAAVDIDIDAERLVILIVEQMNAIEGLPIEQFEIVTPPRISLARKKSPSNRRQSFLISTGG